MALDGRVCLTLVACLSLGPGPLSSYVSLGRLHSTRYLGFPFTKTRDDAPLVYQEIQQDSMCEELVNKPIVFCLTDYSCVCNWSFPSTGNGGNVVI